MPKIVDCFTFSTELDLLEARLSILAPEVDHFVLVEGGMTFQGEPKPYHFRQNRARFAAWLPKIMAVEMPGPAQIRDRWDSWESEYQSREAVWTGLRNLPLAPDTLVMLSDVDEVPNLAKWLEYGSPRAAVFYLLQSYYFMDYRAAAGIRSPGTCMVEYGALWDKWRSLQCLRDSRESLPGRIRTGGWHWSYLGGPRAIRNKLQSFAHAEYNRPPFTDLLRIEEMMRAKTDVLDRPGLPSYEKVPLDESFPAYVRVNRTRLLERGLLSPEERKTAP